MGILKAHLWAFGLGELISHLSQYSTNGPRSKKTCLRGFRPGPTQTRLCTHRRWLEALGRRRIVQSMYRNQRRWSVVRLPHKLSAALFTQMQKIRFSQIEAQIISYHNFLIYIPGRNMCWSAIVQLERSLFYITEEGIRWVFDDILWILKDFFVKSL